MKVFLLLIDPIPGKPAFVFSKTPRFRMTELNMILFLDELSFEKDFYIPRITPMTHKYETIKRRLKLLWKSI